MSKGRSKTQKHTLSTQYCQEKCCCETDKAPAGYLCSDCGTYQCEACVEELHKEGDFFFHERAPLNLMTQQQTAGSNNRAVPHKAETSKLQAGLEGTSAKPTKKSSTPVLKPQSLGTVLKGSCETAQSHHNNSFADEPKPLRSTLDGQLPLPELEVPPVFEESDIGSGEFHSLGLDSILSSDLNNFDMKGPKKSRSKKSGQHSSTKLSPGLEQIISIDVDPNSDYFSAQGSHKVVTRESDPNESQSGVLNGPTSLQSDGAGDEDLISDLMQSMTETQLNGHLQNDVRAPLSATNKPDSTSQTTHKSTSSRGVTITTAQSFLLIDETETIKVVHVLTINQSVAISVIIAEPPAVVVLLVIK